MQIPYAHSWLQFINLVIFLLPHLHGACSAVYVGFYAHVPIGNQKETI